LSKAPKKSPASSLRIGVDPSIARTIWILGTTTARSAALVEALETAGHNPHVAEQGNELNPSLKDHRPDLIIIDMQEARERGRHVGGQLRADRSTRQVPIILVGLGDGEEAVKFEKAVTGPTRRYVLGLDAPSVIGSIVAEL